MLALLLIASHIHGQSQMHMLIMNHCLLILCWLLISYFLLIYNKYVTVYFTLIGKLWSHAWGYIKKKNECIRNGNTEIRNKQWKWHTWDHCLNYHRKWCYYLKISNPKSNPIFDIYVRC